MLAKILINKNGTVCFYNEKHQYHRIKCHAIEWASGNKQWFYNGRLSRLDGPAIECHDGRKEWFINNVEYSEKEFNELVGSL